MLSSPLSTIHGLLHSLQLSYGLESSVKPRYTQAVGLVWLLCPDRVAAPSSATPLPFQGSFVAELGF